MTESGRVERARGGILLALGVGVGLALSASVSGGVARGASENAIPYVFASQPAPFTEVNHEIQPPIKVRATSPDGRPLPGLVVTLTLRDNDVNANLKDKDGDGGAVCSDATGNIETRCVATTDANGDATFPIAIDQSREGYRLFATTVTPEGGVLEATSLPFDVYGAPHYLTFSPDPPPLTEVNTRINGSQGEQVIVEDSRRVRVRKADVVLTIGNNVVGGNLKDDAGVCSPATPTSPTRCTATTDSSGIATFRVAIDKAQPEYVLVATSGEATQDSQRFMISSPTGTTLCVDTTVCENTIDSSELKTTSTVAATWDERVTRRLGQAFISEALFRPDPNRSQFGDGACETAGFDIVSTGVAIDVDPDEPVPTKRVTWRLDKSVVNSQPNNGVDAYDICLGTVDGPGNPAYCPPGISSDACFPPKPGTAAYYDAATGYYWALLPNCTSPATTPCVIARKKNKAGDMLVTFAVPTPWDEKYFGG